MNRLTEPDRWYGHFVDLPTAVLLVVLVGLGVVIVVVLEHRLTRIRRLPRTTATDLPEPSPDAPLTGREAASAAIVSTPATAPERHPATAAGATDSASRPLDPRSATSLDIRRHVLMQGQTELATLVTVARTPPWLDCRFMANPAFDRYRPLFEHELELLGHAGGTFDQEAFVEQWQRIFGAGLWVRADPSGDHVSRFLLHVQPDGTARLRYG